MGKNTPESTATTLIPESLVDAYNEVIKAQAEIDAAKKRLDAAKEKIKKLHKDTGVKSIRDKGFWSTLAPGARTTLIEAKLVEHFGEIPEDCKKTTVYETLKIGQTMVNG